MSRWVSTANVENVVNPPMTPVLSSRRSSGLSGHFRQEDQPARRRGTCPGHRLVLGDERAQAGGPQRPVGEPAVILAAVRAGCQSHVDDL
jgi:hypothetical protein